MRKKINPKQRQTSCSRGHARAPPIIIELFVKIGTVIGGGRARLRIWKFGNHVRNKLRKVIPSQYMMDLICNKKFIYFFALKKTQSYILW